MNEWIGSTTALIIAVAVLLALVGIVVALVLRNRRNRFASPLE